MVIDSNPLCPKMFSKSLGFSIKYVFGESFIRCKQNTSFNKTAEEF